MTRKKKFLYLNRKAPHGTIHAFEALETVLIGAAFDQNVSIAFVDDGVYQIKNNQDVSALKIKDFHKTYRLLSEVYEIEQIYVEIESLQRRGLNEDDLIVPVKLVNSQTLSTILAVQDIVLSF